MPRTPTWERRSSTDAESAVAAALTRQGWRILLRNIRGIGFELDLVASKGATLAFIEVKARRDLPPDERTLSALVPWRKRRSLRRGADAVLSRIPLPELRTVRFDLAVVHRGGIAYYVAFM